MFPQYYDLKDENKLPITAKFVDPYDGTEYRPLPKETLTQFIGRISSDRQKKDYPEFFPHEVKMLVIMHLAETAARLDLKNLFEPKAITPDFAQVVNLAKTLVQQKYYFHAADYQTRQKRAASCGPCKLHRTNTKNLTTLSDSVKKLAGLKDLVQSPEEKALGMCGACGCALTAKVGFDLQAVLASLSPEQIRSILLLYGPQSFDICWMLRECVEDANLQKILARKVVLSGERTKEMLDAYKSEKIMRAQSGAKK